MARTDDRKFGKRVIPFAIPIEIEVGVKLKILRAATVLGTAIDTAA